MNEAGHIERDDSGHWRGVEREGLGVLRIEGGVRVEKSGMEYDDMFLGGRVEGRRA